jgi:hypothetical protein
VRIPTPINGWRVFAGEVGVIVLGVLLALGAQQLAEDMQMRGEVATFRETIDREIGLNLYGYQARTRQAPCIAKRLDELNAWLEKARSGQSVPPLRGSTPFSISPYRSAWDNRNAAVFAKLPSDVRTRYAEFYDELTNNTRLYELESASWLALAPYMEPGPISLADRRTIRPALGAVSNYNRLILGNLELSQDIGKYLGVRPVAPDGIADDVEKYLANCRSAIAER